MKTKIDLDPSFPVLIDNMNIKKFTANYHFAV